MLPPAERGGPAAVLPPVVCPGAAFLVRPYAGSAHHSAVRIVAPAEAIIAIGVPPVTL